MENKLAPRTTHIALRLVGFIVLSGFTPFAIVGLYSEQPYGIIFYSLITILILPEFYFKTFCIPFSGSFNEGQLVLRYLLKKPKNIPYSEITGYFETEEQTKSKMESGILLFTTRGKKIEISEIGIKDISLLSTQLKQLEIPNYGVSKLGPWFRRYSKTVKIGY